MTEQDAVQAALVGVWRRISDFHYDPFLDDPEWMMGGDGCDQCEALRLALDVLVAAVKVEALRGARGAMATTSTPRYVQRAIDRQIAAAEAELESARRRMEALK